MALSALLDQLARDRLRHGGRWTNPAFWAVGTYRVGRFLDTLPPGPTRWLGSKCYGALFLGVELATGITLNREVQVGADFHLVHNGNIKIHPGVVIGDRCGIMHDVTIGSNMERVGVPRIGNDVFIGAGAKVLGAIRIGDGARIAANSLVISDVPAGATAIGVPARILQYTGRVAPNDAAASSQRER
jgi:serine O-acetyltransferase